MIIYDARSFSAAAGNMIMVCILINVNWAQNNVYSGFLCTQDSNIKCSWCCYTSTPPQGKGTEIIVHYPRARLAFLDIPNIHAVRDSYDGLRTLCLSPTSSKWLSSLENTGWLTYLSIIIKVRPGTLLYQLLYVEYCHCLMLEFC